MSQTKAGRAQVTEAGLRRRQSVGASSTPSVHDLPSCYPRRVSTAGKATWCRANVSPPAGQRAAGWWWVRVQRAYHAPDAARLHSALHGQGHRRRRALELAPTDRHQRHAGRGFMIGSAVASLSPTAQVPKRGNHNVTKRGRVLLLLGTLGGPSGPPTGRDRGSRKNPGSGYCWPAP